MKRRSVIVGTVAALPVAAVALGLAAGAALGHHPEIVELQSSGGTTVNVDPNVGETFTPYNSARTAPPDLITAGQAYQSFASRSADLPATMSVELGYLTLPPTADNQLVYAYTSTSCGPQILPAPPPGSDPVEPTSAPKCKQWLFVDASTAEMVDLTWSE
jgi:hypothetical protein